MRRSSSLVAVLSLAVVLALVSAIPLMAAVTPEKILGQAGVDEGLAFSNTQYLAWTQNSNGRPRHYDAFAQLLTGGPRIKLNAPGTEGYPGGFDPGTNTVIFQQTAQSSDLYFFDLDTQQRTKVPGVNTKRWEWGGHISSSYILFNRIFKKNGTWYDSMLLYNRLTDSTVTLDTWRDENTYQPTGNVGESYASWTFCGRSACRAFVYDIVQGTTRRLPTAAGSHQYAPVVDEANGHVYYVESGDRCGSNVSIWRLPVGDFSVPKTRIVDLPDDVDTGWVMSLAPNASVAGSQDLFFERWRCRAQEADIFVARDATSVPDAPAAAQAAGGTVPSSFDFDGRATLGTEKPHPSSGR